MGYSLLQSCGDLKTFKAFLHIFCIRIREKCKLSVILEHSATTFSYYEQLYMCTRPLEALVLRLAESMLGMHSKSKSRFPVASINSRGAKSTFRQRTKVVFINLWMDLQWGMGGAPIGAGDMTFTFRGKGDRGT